MTFYDVLGIDPGSQRTGWGIVRERSGVLQLVDCGIIRTQSHGSENGSGDFSRRLAQIYSGLCTVISSYLPCAAAIEQVFTAKNAASALKLGQARGAAVAACAAYNLEIFDYEPTLVKKSLTGQGRAEKEQVAFMVKRLLNVRESSWPLDTSDALALAICHLSSRRFNMLTQKSRSGGNCA